MTARPLTAEDLRRAPNPLAVHYSRFGVAGRLLLTGHSHQAWPDVAHDAQVEAFDAAAAAVDAKWDRAFAKADEVRAGYRRLLGDPGGDIALGANTHELVVRFLSALGLVGGWAPGGLRLVTTDGEFHSLRRQLTRLAEEGVEVVWVEADPADTLAGRLAEAVDDRTLAVLVSAVLFETARVVPGLDALAVACSRRGVELLVDAYHALGCVPVAIHDLGLSSAWVVGGGYKYLQLGEGNCFLRLPEHAADMRPVVTGWFAEFTGLADDQHPELVTYAPGGDRFAGATYDPTSHYRAARVFGFFAEQGLTPAMLRESYLHQRAVLAGAFDALDIPDELVTRDRVTPPPKFGGFLALETPHAERLHADLRLRGVSTDWRGRHLRFGPAPYLSDAQLEASIAALGEAVAAP
ncbi:MAG: kynureninase [Acidimicrobiales bacterium]